MRLKTFKSITRLALGLLALGLHTSIRAEVSRIYPGYVDSVDLERAEKPGIEVSFDTSSPLTKRDLVKVIFAPQLEREFRNRYEELFGRTPIEQEIQSFNQFTYVEYSSGVRVSLEEDLRNQRLYGEYVIKRLIEHHLDEYFKSDPQLRPIYELKETISNYRVEVQKGWEFKIQYLFSQNAFEAKLTNPYEIRSSVKVQFDPQAFGPGRVQETELRLGYDITKLWKIDTYYQFNANKQSLVVKRSLGPDKEVYLQTVQNFKNDPSTSSGEDLTLLGLSMAN